MYIYIYIMRASARTFACEAAQPHARPYASLTRAHGLGILGEWHLGPRGFARSYGLGP